MKYCSLTFAHLLTQSRNLTQNFIIKKMLRHLKNFLIYDVPPDHSEFLTTPGGYLRRVLFDYENPEYQLRHDHGSSSSSGYFSAVPTPRPSTSTSCSNSLDLPIDVADDGHPGGLGNPKILQLILKYLSVRDLLRLRLVSLRWNVVAVSILQKRLGYTKVPPSKMKSYMKLVNASFANPMASYAIRIDDIRERRINKFLHTFSLQIRNLRVKINIGELVDFAKFLQNMPNVRHLHVVVFEENARSSKYFMLSSSYDNLSICDEKGAWKNGLYSFPRLTHLIFESEKPTYCINPFYDQVIANVITACGNLRELRLISWNSPLGKIFTKFELGTHKKGIVDLIGKQATTEEIVYLFFTVNLRFNQLKLEVTSQVQWELLTDVIHKCGDSLLELTVLNETIFENFKISSVLRSLVILRLNMWKGPVDFTYFARQFPALKLISLNLSNLFEVDQMHGAMEVEKMMEPCNTVKTLTMTRLETGVDASLVEKLAILFPNVKELFVEVRNGDAVKKIYEVYPWLTLLCIELNQDTCAFVGNDIFSQDKEQKDGIDNECFTGIPDEEIQVIKEKECGCHVLQFEEESRSCWNIGCLKDLVSLLVRLPNTVNNIAMVEGISRLENLQNLVLLPFYNEAEEPVKWCAETIANSFPKLRTLVTSIAVEYTEQDLNCFVKRIPNLVHRRRP